MIGILALQGDFQAHYDAVSRLGEPARFVRKPSELEGAAGLILPGGESSTLLKLLESENLWEPLQQFADAHPIFGTCAGAILMAARVENPAQPSLGLIPMTVRRNAYGRQLASSIRMVEVALSGDPQSQPEPPLEAVLIRAPIITEIGPGVEVFARLDGRPVAVRKGPYIASTFHPELSTDHRMHQYFISLVSRQKAEQASHLL